MLEISIGPASPYSTGLGCLVSFTRTGGLIPARIVRALRGRATGQEKGYHEEVEEQLEARTILGEHCYIVSKGAVRGQRARRCAR